MTAAAEDGLTWLHPTLDRCRDLIASRTHVRQWTKRSTYGRADELVTELDLAVEALLVDAIHQRLADAAVLSEESSPDPAALAADTCFVIDPIDGTNELAAGRPGFAVSIACFRRGRPVAAIIDMPAVDRRIAGVAGSVPLANNQPVVLSKTEDLGQARLAVSATQLEDKSLAGFWETVGVSTLAPTPGFVAKLAAVLAGDCDAALYLPTRARPAAIWDYAAPAFLLSEAGGWFGSTDGVVLLDQLPFTHTGGWIASPQQLSVRLLAIVETSERG